MDVIDVTWLVVNERLVSEKVADHLRINVDLTPGLFYKCHTINFAHPLIFDQRLNFFRVVDEVNQVHDMVVGALHLLLLL